MRLPQKHMYNDRITRFAITSTDYSFDVWMEYFDESPKAWKASLSTYLYDSFRNIRRLNLISR